MTKARKTYTTFNKTRLALFVRSYAFYAITYYLRKKYKIETKLKPKELRKNYSKYALPEISRLAKVLNLNYGSLWEAIILNKNQGLGKGFEDEKQMKLYLSVERELISLVKAKQQQSDYTDPDYEDELGILTTAIERAAGNALDDIDDDLVFEQQFGGLKRKYLYLYYKTAHKYKLPTIRIVPFVMRLITSYHSTSDFKTRRHY